MGVLITDLSGLCGRDAKYGSQTGYDNDLTVSLHNKART